LRSTQEEENQMTRIAFDIGGCLSKYPDIFRPLVQVLLLSSELEVFVISDMKPHQKATTFCHDNGFAVPPQQVICADYETHGERCKAVVCQEHHIDILIDDHAGYLAILGTPPVRLLMMPDPDLPYYHESWQTDGSEGDFGRRNPPGSKRPPEDRGRQQPTPACSPATVNLHQLTLDEIGQLRRQCEMYLETWYGFSPESRSRRTPEWVAAALWRLDGQIEHCCYCGADYPRADLVFGDHVCCAQCRQDKPTTAQK